MHNQLYVHTRAGIIIAFLAAALCAGCVAPIGRLPMGCSGVPGDFRTPAAAVEQGEATHGPGAPGRPVAMAAVSRPPLPMGAAIPLLYVFDDEAAYVNRLHGRSELLADPALALVEKEAYWMEADDTSVYLIPELDKCQQSAMFKESFSFVAPSGGLLFVQYIPETCAQCVEITAAIERLIASNGELPVRWIRVAVPRTIGELNEPDVR